MFRSKRIIVAILLTALQFNAFAANAQQKEIKIVTSELPPYAYTKDGHISGVATDIVRDLMIRAGFTGDIYSIPWKRAISESAHSRLMYPLAKTPDRLTHYKWIGPIMKDQLVFVVRASDTRIFNHIEDFRRLKIGVNRGAPTELRLGKLGFRNIDSAATEGQNLEKLLAGRFDVWFASLLVLKGASQRLGIGDKELKVAFTDQHLEQYIGASPDIEDKTISLWQKNLDEMKSDGTYQAIMKRHGIHSD